MLNLSVVAGISVRREVMRRLSQLTHVVSTLLRESRLIPEYVSILNICLIVTFLMGLFMTNVAISKDLAITREVIIPREGAWPNEPNIIVRADDGGFILAGGPWVIKIDADGKVLWRYVRDKLIADYTGAVAMPDGTTFLCGSMQLLGGREFSPSIFTHLDASGNLLNEQLIFPQNKAEHGGSHFDGCVRWGSGIAVVGRIHNVLRQASGSGSAFTAPLVEKYYWLMMLDSDGKVQWEKQIPTTLITLMESGRYWLRLTQVWYLLAIVLIRRNCFGSIKRGEVVAKKLLPGYFQFLRAIVPDGKLKVLGVPIRYLSLAHSMTNLMKLTVYREISHRHSTLTTLPIRCQTNLWPYLERHYMDGANSTRQLSRTLIPRSSLLKSLSWLIRHLLIQASLRQQRRQKMTVNS
jgi:hypothetical protein